MSQPARHWFWLSSQHQQIPTEKILISACLVGKPVRYNGRHSRLSHPLLQQWFEEGRLVVLCPEVAGGLAVPRKPVERQPDGRLLTEAGDDLSAAFIRGADVAEQLVRQERIRLAVLKESSPSCGSQTVYDGRFRGRKVAGQGLTCERLRRLGVAIFNEHQLDEAGRVLESLQRARSE